MNPDRFAESPFNLDSEALAWVERSFAGLDLDGKLGQVMIAPAYDMRPASFDAAIAARVGGIHRPAGAPVEALRSTASDLQSRSKVPLLMSVDIEFSETNSLAGGTAFPNQMGVGATADPIWAERMGLIAAREGLYRGFNWSFTPVVDLALNLRSPVVNTRAFSSDPVLAAEMAARATQAMQSVPFIAGTKHFPGDGHDDRDQHFVTSRNGLPMDEWRATYGRVFSAVIEAGVKSIMAGHVTLPAYGDSLGRKSGARATLPASLNPDLNFGLLRDELGFNGVILADAMGMVGFTSQGRPDELLVQCLMGGCDVLLFPGADAASVLKRALADGRVTQARIDEAVTRVLALKASIGLHRSTALPDEAPWVGEHRKWTTGAAEAGITLVRDEPKNLPLDPKKHRRLLLIEQPERRSASGPLPPLAIAEMFRSRGFEVAKAIPGEGIDSAAHDLAIYLVAIEGASAKESIKVPWSELHGPFVGSMTRAWLHMPTIFVSLGNPFHPYEMPDCPTYVNAYSPIVPVQEAVVKALVGELPFRGRSPVDPFAGI
jgi:beta-N-acetylhexosaminidase